MEIIKIPGRLSGSGSTSVSNLYGTAPTIFNLTVTLANTEVSQLLPANTKKILVRCRGRARTQFSFTLGTSGTNFITIMPGAMYAEDLLLLNSTTVYLQTSLPSQIVEILVWT